MSPTQYGGWILRAWSARYQRYHILEQCTKAIDDIKIKKLTTYILAWHSDSKSILPSHTRNRQLSWRTGCLWCNDHWIKTPLRPSRRQHEVLSCRSFLTSSVQHDLGWPIGLHPLSGYVNDICRRQVARKQHELLPKWLLNYCRRNQPNVGENILFSELWCEDSLTLHWSQDSQASDLGVGYVRLFNDWELTLNNSCLHITR